VEIKIPSSEIEFTFARSSGPGGQNVNKTSSKAILRWNLWESPSVSQAVKDRFSATFSTRITVNGDVVIHSDESRDRAINEKTCLEKLLEMLKKVWTPPKKRVPTKPTKGSQRRRMDSKKLHGDVKKGRKRVQDE
jgi:ribosome-associated protein